MKRMVLAIILLLAAANAHALETMLSKARSLTLPTLQYRETSVRAILEDIQRTSAELDAEGIGVNFVIVLDDALLNQQLTMTLNGPTIERALKLLAAIAPVYFQYEPGTILVKRLSDASGATGK